MTKIFQKFGLICITVLKVEGPIWVINSSLKILDQIPVHCAGWNII